MRWGGLRQSTNVEDRRGAGGPVMFGGGRMLAGGGIGGIVILVLILLFGGNPLALLSGLPSGAPSGPVSTGTPSDEAGQFVAAVLGSTEDVWSDLFRRMNRSYRKPALVLFTGQTSSGCGLGDAAVGPFYCPTDQSVYIDLSFYRALRDQLGAPGDFAQAYVIAHEVGHHVQNLLGVTDRVHDERGRLSEREYNALSVQLELQADFYAGVWAHYAQKQGVLEVGDIEEAMRAAAAIGDDRLQRQSRGQVRPDSFTHGTSEQRVRWFRRGLETGDPAQGDTFNAGDL